MAPRQPSRTYGPSIEDLEGIFRALNRALGALVFPKGPSKSSVVVDAVAGVVVGAGGKGGRGRELRSSNFRDADNKNNRKFLVRVARPSRRFPEDPKMGSAALLSKHSC